MEGKMKTITIHNGTYKQANQITDQSGQTFDLVHGYREDARGGFVAVRVNNQTRRIRVADTNCFTINDGPAVCESTVTETDEETIARLRDRFAMLGEMTKAVKKGDVRAMIVSGPPGVGKSHGVEEVLDRYKLLEDMGAKKTHEVVKGAMSALGLYAKLFKMADAGSIVVFDDCDSVFADELSLNILKAALDSKKSRWIHWNTDSRLLRNEGIPSSFKFEGSAIFITNLKFDKVKGKLREHLEALESRCHYIDLTIDTEREKMLRIRQVIQDGMLDNYELTNDVKNAIIDYVDENKKRLRELSLRSVLKVADLAVAFPGRWQQFAENTVMRRS